MADSSTAVATRPQASVVPFERGAGLQLQDMNQALDFCAKMIDAGVATGKPGHVLARIQAGAELGLGPMASLRMVYAFDNKVMLDAQVQRALVRRARVLRGGTDIDCAVEGGVGEARYGVCRSHRRSWADPRETRFSWAEAKQAGLLTKNNWRSYPEDMLIARASSRHCKLYYTDVLLGMPSLEELDVDPSGVPVVGRGTTAVSADAPAPEVPAQPDPLFTAVEQPATPLMIHAGTIAEVQPEKGYTKINMEDGHWFGTSLSDVIRDATAFRSTGERVEISYQESKKGNRALAIHAADQPPGE